ncbi:helix-turn-helix transcriptional regulator [Mycobacteroides chelonae]|nr:helix-turn-helix transcriptional regulator [Mycobacteroides chelonae]
MTNTTPPPEAALIRRLREARPLGRARAAALIGYSEGWWRHFENGYRELPGGKTIPVRADDDQLVQMAIIVGASEADLRYAGRERAAELLSEARVKRNGIAAPRMEDSGYGDWVDEIVEVQLAQPDLPEDRRVAILECRARFKGYEDAVQVRLNDPLVSEEYRSRAMDAVSTIVRIAVTGSSDTSGFSGGAATKTTPKTKTVPVTKLEPRADRLR